MEDQEGAATATAATTAATEKQGDARLSMPLVAQFSRQLGTISSKVDEVEQRVKEVTCFYNGKKLSGNLKGSSAAKEKKPAGSANPSSVLSSERCKAKDSGSKQLLDGRTKRMNELMRQFGTILRQLQQHKWSWPFMDPVDVEGLGLQDYFDIIKKPMDFSTIKKKMEEKDGTGYKNVREIYADVRLVFTNAMTYNDEKHDIHIMAKSMLDKFEDKWLQLLPKVIEEERRQAEEEAQVQEKLQMAQEAAFQKIAAEADSELDDLNKQLEGLKRLVVQKCRKMSVEEKRKIGAALGKLSHDDLQRVLDIIAQENPGFKPTNEVVDLDLDDQTEITLWRLKFFLREALESQSRNVPGKADEISKRKKEICDALAKTAAKKRSKLLTPP